eukprot:CAMPEP_0206429180 /NCGR_PEP_ID=MMETSP0324_2-20121206/6088_1 /ASSEMBLY_ACC=CAM_ASM_000836 /TAXON_ID=2866 /ORGANISM="Crypthecodinium cohnii, Strain Seligo" /LENGTH=243 /DNA_ID=CAMNT_0053894813 /DNA_START=246 /DNA_END=977 /DNA_ORIENTATION=+
MRGRRWKILFSSCCSRRTTKSGETDEKSNKRARRLRGQRSFLVTFPHAARSGGANLGASDEPPTLHEPNRASRRRSEPACRSSSRPSRALSTALVDPRKARRPVNRQRVEILQEFQHARVDRMCVEASYPVPTVVANIVGADMNVVVHVVEAMTDISFSKLLCPSVVAFDPGLVLMCGTVEVYKRRRRVRQDISRRKFGPLGVGSGGGLQAHAAVCSVRRFNSSRVTSCVEEDCILTIVGVEA